jgi:hypothetical protein
MGVGGQGDLRVVAKKVGDELYRDPGSEEVAGDASPLDPNLRRIRAKAHCRVSRSPPKRGDLASNRAKQFSDDIGRLRAPDLLSHGQCVRPEDHDA